MKRIYVLTGRWVLIGETAFQDSHVRLTDASVIRRWGTTKGLGQIALEGPQKETVLDACGTVTFPVSAILFSIDCAK